jgi:acetyl esterase/lipase
MHRWTFAVGTALLAACGLAGDMLQAQESLPAGVGAAAELAGFNSAYRVTPDVTYLTASGTALKLDVYEVLEGGGPAPTLLYTHGGGWSGGSKEASSLALVPYLHMRWNVVNVEYRGAGVALAPAAVEDTLCALRWVYRNATQYNFDTSRIVASGESSGGHLALMAAMAPASAGLDRQCAGPEDLKVAAVINWYGPSEVRELLDGPHARPWAVGWFGSLPDRDAIAARVSPIRYVRPGLPPVLTIHGDADPVVPYGQSVRLHQALTKAGVPNHLLTIPGGRHDAPKGFAAHELRTAFGAILQFLGSHGLRDAVATAQR